MSLVVGITLALVWSCQQYLMRVLALSAVCFSGSWRMLIPATCAAVQVEFEALRTAGTLPGMFITTPYDMHSSRW